MIIYLHGFNSSPLSTKSQLLEKKMAELDLLDRFFCPTLSYQPKNAIALIEDRIKQVKTSPITFIGSSLGGFYATWLAEKYNCQAALINPAVRPYEGLNDHVGPQKNYHTGEEYDFKSEYIKDLANLEVGKITQPERYLLLVETGDEVCPYEKAVVKYQGAQHIIIEGGDHSFQSFPQYIESLLRFAKLIN